MTDTAATEQLASDLVGQKLQLAEEVYVYKIPPLKSAGGHRADDWNLADPLKTCSLLVEQHGDVLLLLFRFLQNPDDPTSITDFAKTKINLAADSTTDKKLSLEYFVESVVDSSRYFVVRIVDEKSGREAHVGFGFREREEATDFREALNYYQKSIRREEEAALAMKQFEESDSNKLDLALGEGQKIHISLGGKSSKRGSKSTIVTPPDKSDNSSPKAKSSTPMLLKKPPPAAPILDQDISISFGDIDIKAGRPSTGDSSTAALGDASSAGDALLGDAPTDGGGIDDDEDDEFGDFQWASIVNFDRMPILRPSSYIAETSYTPD